MPAIIKYPELQLENEIKEIAADWICGDYSINNDDVILKEKASWISKFNKDWMNETSKLKDYSKYFYLKHVYIVQYFDLHP